MSLNHISNVKMNLQSKSFNSVELSSNHTNKISQYLLHEIHVSHMGISKTKLLAGAYFLWINLDENIEQIIKTGEVCGMFTSDHLTIG